MGYIQFWRSTSEKLIWRLMLENFLALHCVTDCSQVLCISSPLFYLGRESLHHVNNFKYLGPRIVVNNTEDDSIHREICKFFVGVYILYRRFSKRFTAVKTILFNIYAYACITHLCGSAIFLADQISCLWLQKGIKLSAAFERFESVIIFARSWFA
jgi:hypothetical protein